MRASHLTVLAVRAVQAVRTFLGYHALKIQGIFCLVLQRRQAALNCFAGMQRCRPQDRYALASQGHVRAQMGDFASALLPLQQLVDLDLEDASAWFNLGYVLEQADQRDEAATAFRRALTIQPGMDRAWYGLALVLIQTDQLDEAVVALRKNTALQPSSPFGWYQLARLHAERHEPAAALQIIQRLKQFEPKVAAQLERETGLVALAHCGVDPRVGVRA